MGTEFDALAYDSCGVLTPNYTLTGATSGSSVATLAGTAFNVGHTTVSWLVKDVNDNTALCSFDVLVLPCIEITGNLIWEGDNTDHTGVALGYVRLDSLPIGMSAIDTDGPTNGGTLPLGGAFSLTATAPGDFVVTPSKLCPCPPVDPLNGVSAADATIIQQHLINSPAILDPYKRIAADVNLSNSITSADVAIIRQALMGNQSARFFFSTKPWRFVPTKDTLGSAPSNHYSLGYNPPLNPFSAPIPSTRTILGVTSSVDSVNFYGIKLGDVDATANPLLHPTAPDPLALLVQDQQLVAGQDVLVVFRASNFTNLAAWQFALRFDPAVLAWQNLELASTPLGLLADDHFGLYNVAEGDLSSVWSEASGFTLPEGTQLFTLHFKALQGGMMLSEVLDLKPKAIEPNAFTPDPFETGLELVFTPPVTTGVGQLGTLTPQLLQNRPNPFGDRTSIGFILPEACDAQLRIMDASGRELLHIDKSYPAGYHEEVIRLDGTSASGLLYYELTTPQGTQTRKMMLTRN